MKIDRDILAKIIHKMEIYGYYSELGSKNLADEMILEYEKQTEKLSRR